MTTKKNTPRVTFLDPAGALRALIDAIETAASELRRARDLAGPLPREGDVVAEIDRALLQLTGMMRVVKGEEYRRRHPESTAARDEHTMPRSMVTHVDIYRDDEGEWCYAAFVGGEFDVSDTLGCEDDVSEVDVRREAEAQFPGATITRVADASS